MSIRVGKMFYEAFDNKALPGWDLTEGVKLLPEGHSHILQVFGITEAICRAFCEDNYTLVFHYLPGNGKGSVSLQRSGKPPRFQEYQLKFEDGRVAVLRVTNGEALELGAAELRLASNEWYDISVHALSGGMRITVDRSEVLVVEDREPLPAGIMAFGSLGDQPVAYDNILLTAQDVERAEDIRQGACDLESGPAHALPQLELDPKSTKEILTRAAVLRANQAERLAWQDNKSEHIQMPDDLKMLKPDESRKFVPLQSQTHDGAKQPSPIDLEIVPPNFVHTWAIDIKNLTTCKLRFGDTIRLYLDEGDRLTVVDSANEILKELPPDVDDQNSFECSGTKYDAVPYKRIYVVLETSYVDKPRSFQILGLVNCDRHTGSEEALLVTDDLDPDLGGISIAETKDSSGNVIKLPPPWNQKWWINCPLAKPSDGWYLIGKNLTDTSPGFYSLVYYNESQSLLRLYLARLSVLNTTLYTAKASLIRWQDRKSLEIEGAIFPVHPDPRRWSSVTLPIPRWPQYRWVYVDIPVLYPMARDLPIDKAFPSPGKPDHYYHSLFEESLLRNLRNVALQVEVNPIDEGKLRGNIVGQAIGTAIEKLNNSGDKPVVEKIKGAKRIYDEVKAYYTDQKKTNPFASGMKALGSIVAQGYSTFFGGLSLASTVYDFFKSLFDDKPEPLQLSIELDIVAELTADLTIAKQPHLWHFYLPGRFSIREAFLPDNGQGLLKDNPQLIAASLPRYDRIMGSYGFPFNPAVIQIDTFWAPPYHGGFQTVFDSKDETDFFCGFVIMPSTATRDFETSQPPTGKVTWDFKEKGIGTDSWAKATMDLLPVVYNPYVGLFPGSFYNCRSTIQISAHENPNRSQSEAYYQDEPHILSTFKGFSPDPVKYRDFSIKGSLKRDVPLDTYLLVKSTDDIQIGETQTSVKNTRLEYPVSNVICHWYIPTVKFNKDGDPWTHIAHLEAPITMKEHHIVGAIPNDNIVVRMIESDLLVLEKVKI